ncbi:MAG: membrane protein insertase YidC [Candidatus Omnitrophica bacterium]|nr:membrane protein insertase YidC [Candidatus Omnitrophota bacterium]
MNSKETQFGKNYWIAMILLILILMVYPYYLQWISPKHGPDAPSPLEETSPTDTLSQSEQTLSPAEGPFLEPSLSVPPAAIRYENLYYEVVFSTRGASIIRLFYKGEPKREHVTEMLFYDGEPSQPGLFGVQFLHEQTDLSKAIFKLNRSDKKRAQFEFIYEIPGECRLSKEYTLISNKPVIVLKIFLENLSSREKHFPIKLDYGLYYKLTHGLMPQNFEAVVAHDTIQTANLDKISKKGFSVSRSIRWAGVIEKYFAILVKPDWNAVQADATADDEIIQAQLTMEPISLKPGERKEHIFFIYAGTQRYETLKSFEMGFEDLLTRGFFGVFKIWLLISLKFFNRYTHNYGWAILVLTLILKGIFLPITHQGSKSMKKLQALSPKLKAIQEKYKNDPQKMQREVMEIYKRNRVNPMAGCLPMLVQFPVFIAMFRLLPEAIELKGEPFIWWIRDLSQPDKLVVFPFVVPLLGWNSLNPLPILMTATQFVYQQLMPQTGSTPEQAKLMNLFLPIFFGFICYNMPSGLVLYWLMQNLFSIIHQVFINRIVVALHHEDSEPS